MKAAHVHDDRIGTPVRMYCLGRRTRNIARRWRASVALLLASFTLWFQHAQAHAQAPIDLPEGVKANHETLPSVEERILQAKERVAKLERERQPDSDNVVGAAYEQLHNCAPASQSERCRTARAVIATSDAELAITRRLTDLFIAEMTGATPPPKGWVSTAMVLAFDLTDTGKASQDADAAFRAAMGAAHDAPPAPAPRKRSKPGPSVSNADDWAVCREVAQQLIAKGRSCKIDMNRYTPSSICDSLKRDLPLASAVGRLKLQLSENCRNIGFLVEGDRI